MFWALAARGLKAGQTGRSHEGSAHPVAAAPTQPTALQVGPPAAPAPFQACPQWGAPPLLSYKPITSGHLTWREGDNARSTVRGQWRVAHGTRMGRPASHSCRQPWPRHARHTEGGAPRREAGRRRGWGGRPRGASRGAQGRRKPSLGLRRLGNDTRGLYWELAGEAQCRVPRAPPLQEGGQTGKARARAVRGAGPRG